MAAVVATTIVIRKAICNLLGQASPPIAGMVMTDISRLASQLTDLSRTNSDAAVAAILALFDDLSVTMHMRLLFAAALLGKHRSAEAEIIGAKLDPRRLLKNTITADNLIKLLAVLVKLGRVDEAERSLEHFLQTGAFSAGQAAQCVALLASCEKIELSLRALRMLPPIVTTATLNTAVAVIFKLLHQESFDLAREAAEVFNIAKGLATDIPASLKGRLLFLNEILLDGPDHTAQLSDLFKQAPPPWIYTVLAPYSQFLSRKAELAGIYPVEAKAVRWITNALQIEHNLMAFHDEQWWSMSIKWLILAGRGEMAFKIMDEHYQNNPAYAGGYTLLATAFWLIHQKADVLESLAKERLKLIDTPDVIFRTSMCFAFAGEPAKAAEWLGRLQEKDGNYFNRDNIITHWGMLAVILKTMGQESLAARSMAMGAKRDPLHYLRAHILNDIPEPTIILDFPGFSLPRQFYELSG